MRKYYPLLVAFLFACSPDQKPNERLVLEPVSLENVRLLDSPFKNAMLADQKWILDLEPDRLLHRYLLYAGLKPKGEIYGGWESRGISGHSLGHYMSACALMYASTGDERFKQRVDYIVDELKSCQIARKTGYIGAIPDEDKVWNEIAAGDIRSQGFDLNGLWVPWYTQHKLLAGLIDSYKYTDNLLALDIAVKFTDWIDDKFSNLSDAQFQQMLACEFGGMNDALAQLYEITGAATYLDMANRFYHRSVMDPLAAQTDQLVGLHANTQVPKIIGSAKICELTGSTKDSTIAAYFLRKVLADHSYANGGNSEHEHFGPAGSLKGRLSESSSETCNTYNMIKLAQHVNKWEFDQRWGDYIEKALFNHILASQNPENGMVSYFVPLQAGGRKTYSEPFDSFWCCVGTGWESHAKYASFIYYQTAEKALVIDQYIASSLTTSNLQLKLETNFPRQNEIKVQFEKYDSKQPIYLRLPSWSADYQVFLNGADIKTSIQRGYIRVDKPFKSGDELKLTLNMNLRSEQLLGNENKIALFHGPVLLAGVMPEEKESFDYPVFLAKDKPLEEWINWNPKRYAAQSTGVGFPDNITLKPFYEVVNEKYMVYLDIYNEIEWQSHKQKIDSTKKAQFELERRLVDDLRIGEMQPERDHKLAGENTTSGEAFNRKWRHAVDGWFAFQMQVDPNETNELMVTYWGGDAGNREFEILINDQLLASQILNRNKPDQFYNEVYAIPKALTNNKKKVKVTFRSLPGKTAGGVYGCKTLRQTLPNS
ncbi:MAG: glycoside hydrolase family 127 protein [Reichenbachiella sp.]